MLRRSLARGCGAAAAAAAADGAVGFIGLGRMGSAMVDNLAASGRRVVVHDVDASAAERLAAKHSGLVRAAGSAAAVAEGSDLVVSMLPNDRVLKAVAGDGSAFLGALRPGAVHVSCSTVSPDTSRELARQHRSFAGASFVGAPVFARPDGVARREAYFAIGGEAPAARRAVEVLRETSSECFVLGEDPGAGNVLKLSGNFLIACAIEALAEALTLAEAGGLDREGAARILTSTIFDCVIYRGYGQRVAERDHRPGGFALDLGLKDLSLALRSAEEVRVPMPFGSVLRDRFVAAAAKGRADLDWSAIALQASEDAGAADEVRDAIDRARR